MTVHVVHLVDRDAHPDGIDLLGLLVAKLPRGSVCQSVAVSGEPACLPALPDDVPVRRLRPPFTWGHLFSGGHLEPVLDELGGEVLLSWSPSCTAWATSAGGGRPVIPIVCDPAEAQVRARWNLSLFPGTEPPVTVCTSEQVRRRLIEHGIPAEYVLVVRCGVDFSRVRQAGQSDAAAIRETLGLERASPVLLTAPPPSRAGGHFYAVWATAMLRQIMPDIRLVIPGQSRETARLRRLAEASYCPEICVFAGHRFGFAQLLSVSDLLLMAAIDDVSTASLAGAMAAGVPIVGSAVPAVAELLADRHNALLCRPGDPLTLAIRIRTALESREQMKSYADTARGQAYDVFRSQRCVNEFLRLIHNASSGRPVSEGVRDAALME